MKSGSSSHSRCRDMMKKRAICSCRWMHTSSRRFCTVRSCTIARARSRTKLYTSMYSAAGLVSRMLSTRYAIERSRAAGVRTSYASISLPAPLRSNALTARVRSSSGCRSVSVPGTISNALMPLCPCCSRMYISYSGHMASHSPVRVSPSLLVFVAALSCSRSCCSCMNRRVLASNTRSASALSIGAGAGAGAAAGADSGAAAGAGGAGAAGVVLGWKINIGRAAAVATGAVCGLANTNAGCLPNDGGCGAVEADRANTNAGCFAAAPPSGLATVACENMNAGGRAAAATSGSRAAAAPNALLTGAAANAEVLPNTNDLADTAGGSGGFVSGTTSSASSASSAASASASSSAACSSCTYSSSSSSPCASPSSASS
eukprot:Unigene16081_Nuclearia_a/m.47786 Unigene16081_Nuclearia_a/g.47786  ORF Unigene16081_Nuclearia_a/g.47786 Unigene16081_Nuclearia_a/m.47786 type:complete len:375 (+) Unigene16081_Nuclearia_a:117-1241(+)